MIFKEAFQPQMEKVDLQNFLAECVASIARSESPGPETDFIPLVLKNPERVLPATEAVLMFSTLAMIVTQEVPTRDLTLSFPNHLITLENVTLMKFVIQYLVRDTTDPLKSKALEDQPEPLYKSRMSVLMTQMDEWAIQGL